MTVAEITDQSVKCRWFDEAKLQTALFIDGGTVHHVPRTSLKPVASANQAASLEKLADDACRFRSDFEEAWWSTDFDV
jgi:hypothetical protein